MLELTSIRAGYGGFQALFDVSLEVRRGEAVAVIGPNDLGPAKEIVVRGSVFTAMAAPHQGESFQWAVYRKRPAPLDK